MVKFCHRARWRYVSLTFQLFEVYQSSPSKFILFSTSSRFSLLRGFICSEDFNFESSSSNNRSPLIFSDSYATLLFFTFITCNATQRGRLWTTTNFSTCNSNKPIPLIAAVATSRHVQIVQLWRLRPYLSVSILTAQSSISRPPPLTKRTFGKDLLRLWYFDLLTSPDFYNSCHLSITVKLFLLPVLFPD